MLFVQKSDLMPPSQRGRPKINPLPQDKDRNIEKNIDEQFEAQEHGL